MLQSVAIAAYADDDITAVRRNVMTMRPTSRGKIVGQDAKIRGILETIDRVARSSCTVLVTGESGTGKELVIAALHDASDRSAAPLVTINCGAIPAELVESELFGHAKGAFTGAQTARRGYVATAEGGTLFLDEVGELPLSAQVKLLRLLQAREYTPVGESRAVKCDVRIVAATHRNLEAEVRAGRFREDLFYRLNVIQIHLPALRERKNDVRILAQHFYNRFALETGRTDLRGISVSALNSIENNMWQGNVRALENAIERGVLLARGPFVEAEDILGAGSGRAAVVIENTASIDPRREPVESLKPESTKNVPAPESVRLEVKVPPAAHISALLPQQAPVAAVHHLESAGPRHGSNPNFPRVLPTSGVDLFSAVEQYQNNLIRQALARTGGNKNRAAQLLGLNRTTLVEMIRRRGL